MKTAFVVILSGTNPDRASDISGLILLRNLAKSIFRKSFNVWLIRLIVLWHLQLVVQGFLGSVMNVEISMSVSQSSEKKKLVNV